MSELTDYEVQLSEVIHQSGATKGAGATINEMIAAMSTDGSETDTQKVLSALKKLQKTWYVYKIPAVHEGMPDEYFTTNKYQQERELWWQGAKFGKKIIRE